MVNSRSIIGALALIAPFAMAAPTATTVVTKTKTVTSTEKETVTVTKAKTLTIVSTVVTTSTKTITQATTATAPVSTTTTTASASTVTLPASTSTVTQPASTVTLPASTYTVTSTSTVTGPGSTITAPASTVTAGCSTSTSSSSTSATTNPTTTRTALQATGTMGLNDYAALSGRYLGTAVDIPGAELNDPVYMAVANNTHEWGSRTPANTMKYVYTEPSRGVFDFSGGDEFIALAHGAGINHIRCHNLVWYSQLPTWLTSGTWDNATLISIMQNHITSLITHWGDNCTHWDVVNEAFNDDGTWRQDIWYNTIGWEYIPIAYAAAEAAVKANNLNVKLYYNDYNIEAPGAKSNSTQLLVQNLTSMGIQIDGVGLQSHFIAGETWYYTTLEQNFAAITALGVDIALTELDVRVSQLPPTATDELNQYNDYKWPTIACYNTPRCVGITVWDFDDTYSWVPSTFPGQGYADIYALNTTSNQLYKKIAWDGIQQGLTGGNSY